MAPHLAPALGRLKRRPEFMRVAASGRRAAAPGFVLQTLARGDRAPARLGFTVTKKAGNAVVRHRIRRRLREAARLVLAERPVAGADLVLVGKAPAHGRRFTLLLDDLRRALDRAGL